MTPVDPRRIHAINRPDPALMTLYLLRAIFTLAAFPIVILPLYFRYHTLRYRFDDEGIYMSYGILFRRENLVRYARIQDLHITRGLLERWLGLATIDIQTAAGSASAEMSIVGLKNYEEIRDFIYARMRGARFGDEAPAAPAAPGAALEGDALALLTEIRDEIRAIRAHRP